MFENACCCGGCGINLRSVRAGLSLPEVSYALALDAISSELAGRLPINAGRRGDITATAKAAPMNVRVGR